MLNISQVKTKISSAADAIAGFIIGKVTRIRVDQIPAPRILEESSREGSIDPIAAVVNK